MHGLHLQKSGSPLLLSKMVDMAKPLKVRHQPLIVYAVTEGPCINQDGTQPDVRASPPLLPSILTPPPSSLIYHRQHQHYS